MKQVALKRVATIVAGQSPPSSEVDGFEGDGLPFLQGNAEFGALHPIAIHRCDSAPKRCSTGDVLLSVRAPVGALNVADQPYGIGRGLCAVRPSPSIEGRFLWWTLNGLRHELDRNSVGSTYMAVTAEDVGALPVPETSGSTQRAIADFLDAETTRIDALIAKKRRLKAILEDRYWNWVSDRVRKVPAPVVQLRRALFWITDGPFGSSLTSSHYADVGARVVRLSNIGMAEFKDDDKAYISTDHYVTLLKHRVRQGDLLMAGLGDANNHVGRGCVAPNLEAALVKADCYCAAVDQGKADAQFLALYLSSPLGRNAVTNLSRGSTRTRINLDVAKSVPVILPTPSEQKHIVTEANRRRQTNRLLHLALDRQVGLLEEHRQALITAAVTGEVEVPGARAS